jgi:hypothetical protein
VQVDEAEHAMEGFVVDGEERLLEHIRDRPVPEKANGRNKNKNQEPSAE